MTWEAAFGTVKDGDHVEQALLAHLQAWMPTTLTAVLAMKDPAKEKWPNGVAAIRSYTVVHAANENWPEDQLPMLLAYCPGLAAEPIQEGDGTMTASFAVTLTAIASGAGPADTKALGRLYATAALLAILQQPSLGGFARSSEWIDGRNYPVTRGVEAERSLMAVSNMYVIEVPDVLNVTAGLMEPLSYPNRDDPPAGPPSVKEGGGSAEISLVDRLSESGFFGEES